MTKEQITAALIYVRRVHPGARAIGRYIYPSGQRDGNAIPIRLVLPLITIVYKD